MNDTIRVVVESNEERFTKLIKNFTDIQSVAEGMETEVSDIWSKVVFFYDFERLTYTSIEYQITDCSIKSTRRDKSKYRHSSIYPVTSNEAKFH